MNAARQLLIEIALEDVDKVEVSRNRAKWIEKYWPDTSYVGGYANREPYCAAACAFWLAELGRRLAERGQLKATLGKSLVQFNSWRCKSARAFDWLKWAELRGLKVLPDYRTPEPGDFMVFDMSHIGVVQRVLPSGQLQTVEANTGITGDREGEGCFVKIRSPKLALGFVQALPI